MKVWKCSPWTQISDYYSEFESATWHFPRLQIKGPIFLDKSVTVSCVKQEFRKVVIVAGHHWHVESINTERPSFELQSANITQLL